MDTPHTSHLTPRHARLTQVGNNNTGIYCDTVMALFYLSLYTPPSSVSYRSSLAGLENVVSPQSRLYPPETGRGPTLAQPACSPVQCIASTSIPPPPPHSIFTPRHRQQAVWAQILMKYFLFRSSRPEATEAISRSSVTRAALRCEQSKAEG